MARTIGFCLFQYATDHNGHYPEGKTSTEVFQKLLDEGYVNYPQLFYVEIPGKTPAKNNQLKPENVSFDMTCCVDSSSPDGLPFVFLTAYKITYQAGSKAVPLVSPPATTWKEWWNGNDENSLTRFMAVCYKNYYSAKGIKADDDGSIPNFIPADFDPKGKTYRQLTP